MDGAVPAGEVMTIQMTLAGVVSGGDTIVHRRMIGSNGIDQCMFGVRMARAKLPSQKHRRRRKEAVWVAMRLCPCRSRTAVAM